MNSEGGRGGGRLGRALSEEVEIWVRCRCSDPGGLLEDRSSWSDNSCWDRKEGKSEGSRKPGTGRELVARPLFLFPFTSPVLSKRKRGRVILDKENKGTQRR